MQSDTRKPMLAKVSFSPVVWKPIEAVGKITAVCADEMPDVTAVAMMSSFWQREPACAKSFKHAFC